MKPLENINSNGGFSEFSEQNLMSFVIVKNHQINAMKNTNELFSHLWNDYISTNPEVKSVYNLFVGEGEDIRHDHIAFRTFDHPKVNIDVLAKWFIDHGYQLRGEYHFEEKHLYARHYEHKSDKNAPRVFISHLKTNEFSDYLQSMVKDIVGKIPADVLRDEKLLTAGSTWENLPSYNVYNRLREESEYAAWMYLFGYTVNHFAINVNHLQNFTSLEKINEFLKNKGYIMNESGGEIKGSPEKLLEQSSIRASLQTLNFKEGQYEVPVTYYEFTRRYPDANGKLFSGFIAKSADKIFESTDYYNHA